MLRNTLFILMAAILFSCSTKQDQFTISGTIEGVDSSLIYLYEAGPRDYDKLDSIAAKNGSFTFTGSVDDTKVLMISVEGMRRGLFFLADNSEIKIAASVDDIAAGRVTGSAVQEEYNKYIDLIKPLNDKKESMFSAYTEARQVNDTIKMKEISDNFGELQKEEESKREEFISGHPASFATPYLMWQGIFDYDFEALKEAAAKLDPSISSSNYYKAIQERVAILESVSIGKTAPDFTQNDPNGNAVSLSDFKGKYLLVDFWAAWCGPCRAENPNVVAVYNDFNEKGFDVLGVSYDSDEAKWLEAVEKDGLSWTQVSQLNGWKNETAKLYGIMGIPSNVLLDKEGVIIAKNLRGEDLRNKLVELFSE